MQEFVIRVQRGPLPDKSWRVYKRYNDFLKLHAQLQVSGIPLPLPPKKIIGNMDPNFIAERQKQLQVLKFCNGAHLLRFLFLFLEIFKHYSNESYIGVFFTSKIFRGSCKLLSAFQWYFLETSCLLFLFTLLFLRCRIGVATCFLGASRRSRLGNCRAVIRDWVASQKALLRS